MLKKGPELKMPELKVPGFLLDVYYDLRERHLLPLVAILLVALVALPLALRGGSEPEAVSPEAASAGISSSVPSSNLVVAKASPGLRDYRRRLHDNSPRDPFVQQFTGSTAESAGVGSATKGAAPGGSETSPGTVTTTSGGGESSTTEPSIPITPSEGNDELEGTGKLTYYSFVIDARIVPVSTSNDAQSKPTIRRDLPELTMLPSRETPALTFMAVSKDEKKVLMLVNDNVRGLFGDGVCVVGTDSCQLLALEPGIPETVVYGAEERTYRIEILKLHAVKTESLNKAPLGKSRKERSGSKDPE